MNLVFGVILKLKLHKYLISREDECQKNAANSLQVLFQF